jgi:hypothetical protein
MVERSHRMYGQLDASGASALDLLLAERDKLPQSERAELEALSAGWFSVFEVKRVKVDEGMLLRDVLCRREVWVSERAATRQVQLGDVLFGWLTQHDEVIKLEGGSGYVPARLAKPFIASIRRKRTGLARTRAELDWKKQHGLLALPAMALLGRLWEEAPVPRVVNAAGHEVVFSTAYYNVVDSKRVLRLLEQTFEAGPEPGMFCMRLRDEMSLAATLVLRGRELQVQCDSQERLVALKQRLHTLCAGSLQHRADSFEDAQAIMKRAKSAGRSARVARPMTEMPAEVAQQIQATLLERMRTWVDEPVPMLSGKTPREATRTARGRDDVTLMLVHQQQLFDAGEGLPKIDLTEIWRTLGLQPRV